MEINYYPVTPGFPVYNIGSPAFQKARIKLPNGEFFKIVAENYSPDNIYIQSAKLNGEVWTKPWFSHSDIVNGGELVLEMGRYPNKQWGAEPDAAPPSFSMGDKKNL